MDFETEIKNEFLQEAIELLEMAEESFLDFERNPQDTDCIDNIFRLFHTIKGSSYTAGFEQLGKFTHKVENLLSALKDGRVTGNDEICDILLKSNDILLQWIRELAKDLNFQFTSEAMTEVISYIDNLGLDAETKQDPILSSFGFFGESEESPSSSAEAQPQASVPAQSNAKEEQDNVVTLKSAQRSPKVLIVDDEPDIQELIEIYIEGLGLKVLKASNGEEGVAIVRDENPDVILSDLRMPKMDGIEFIEKVREFNKNVPVVFISGAADREDIISFIKLGAFNFVEKPISRDLLVSLVRNGLFIKQMKESVDSISMLNFKMHMTCHQLLRTRDEEKKKKLEVQVKKLLDQLSDLNHHMLELKLLDIA